jgi:hypothetical protein
MTGPFTGAAHRAAPSVQVHRSARPFASGVARQAREPAKVRQQRRVEGDHRQHGADVRLIEMLGNHQQAVRAGEGREDARPLGAGGPHRQRPVGPALDDRSHVVPTLPAVVDPLRESGFDGRRAQIAVPEHREDRRSAKEQEADRRRDRVAWQAEQRRRADPAESQRFAGFILTCQIATSPSARSTSLTRS